MNKDILALAEGYYKAMGEKNISGVEAYLHSEVEFIAPLAKASGKKAFLEATKGFMDFFISTTIRETVGSSDRSKVVVVYNIEFPAPIGNVPSVALLTFQEGLIIRIELFYDARPFM